MMGRQGLRVGFNSSQESNQSAVEPNEGGHQSAIVVRQLPDIDTGANAILTQDREVQVVLTFKTPRIVVLEDVLSDDECDALVRYCEPRLARSSVVADADGNVRVHRSRTSRGVALRRTETELVARIEARLATIAQWPAERSEGLQVLCYGAGEEYRAHFDWIDPNIPGLRKHLEIGGQRLATFILYLSRVESGGGTLFPAVGLEVMPRKRGAVFFVNTDPQYLPNQLTLHAGSPVFRGVKFVANKWLRQYQC
jgi:prolyl 4-hydroxylase